MTETESSAERIEQAAERTVGDSAFQFAAMGQKAVETMSRLQKELIDTCEDINRDLFSHARSETDLASEFTSKLIACRTIPETASVWSDWLNRQNKVLAEGGRRFFSGGQKYMQANTRWMSNGGMTGGT
jgi:hypothetical protein